VAAILLSHQGGGNEMDMIATTMQRLPPPSGRPPEINLAPRDVAALAGELTAYHALFAPLFARTEQRRGALRYLQGHLLDLERKTIEPLALALPGGDVQALQQFIGQSTWDAEAVLVRHQEVVAQTLGDAETGVLIGTAATSPSKGQSRSAWRGSGAGRWARWPIARPAWWPATPAGTAIRWLTAACICRRSGAPRRMRRAGRAAGCRRN